jgi:plastocyanin
MNRGLSTLIACVALVLAAAGCGSSSSSTASSAARTTTPARTTTRGGGLKVNTTPKYASPPPSAPVQSGVVQIAYRNITIQPDAVKVKVGSTISWTNYDSIEHTVTSKSGPQHFASGTFGEGHKFAIRVTKPGVIHYECTIHPTTMNGTIEVVK